MTKQELCQILALSLNKDVNKLYINSIANHIWHKIQSKSDWISFDKYELADQLWFQLWLEKIRQGYPVQYITSSAPFIDLDLEVGPGVLIPRPETEELVYWIHEMHRNDQNLKVLDIGTGSGCIAIYLKKQHPDWEIRAIDISTEALDYAKQNARNNQCNIEFQICDFLNDKDLIKGNFNLIVSNPPYISKNEIAEMDRSVLQFEPEIALFPSGPDPDIFYKKIADYASKNLVKQGSIYVELNEFRYNEVGLAFRNSGFTKLEFRRDIEGKTRMLKVQF